MKDGLAVVDYSARHAAKEAIQRCPTGAIVWIDPVAGPVKGPAAHKVIRRGERPAAPS